MIFMFIFAAENAYSPLLFLTLYRAARWHSAHTRTPRPLMDYGHGQTDKWTMDGAARLTVRVLCIYICGFGRFDPEMEVFWTRSHDTFIHGGAPYIRCSVCMQKMFRSWITRWARFPLTSEYCVLFHLQRGADGGQDKRRSRLGSALIPIS